MDGIAIPGQLQVVPAFWSYSIPIWNYSVLLPIASPVDLPVETSCHI